MVKVNVKNGTLDQKEIDAYVQYAIEANPGKLVTEYQPLHDFQSCALDQLSHLSTTLIFYHIPEELSRTFFKCFLIPLRIGTNFEKNCVQSS